MAKLAERRRKEADAEMAKFDALRRTRDTAAKATAAVNAHVKTFDFEGVAKFMKNPDQVKVFRKCVEAPGIAGILPVSGQAALAKKLVESAKTSGLEFNGPYIRDSIGSLSGAARVTQTRLTKEELAAQERKDALLAIENRFKEAAKFLENAKWKIADVQAKVREHNIRNYAIPHEFAEAVDEWDRAIMKLRNKFQ